MESNQNNDYSNEIVNIYKSVKLAEIFENLIYLYPNEKKYS